MILNTALALAPALLVAIGLAIVAMMTCADSTGWAGARTIRLVAAATLFLALAATARLWIVGHGQLLDVSVLADIGVDPGVRTPSFPLETVRLDAVALIGLTAVLGVGFLVVVGPVEEALTSRDSFVPILFLALLATLIVLSPDVASVATIWVAITLSLAALTLGRSWQASTSSTGTTSLGALAPAIDARRWLTLVIVGTPVFWVVGCALIAATGSSSLIGSHSVPTGIVVGLILIGAVVASIAPFATRRLTHQRRSEIAFVVDGVFPIAGVLLAARAVEMTGSSPSLLVNGVLALIGLSGVVEAIFAVRRGRGIGDAGRIEGSVALLVLIAPMPWARAASIGVVGMGTLIRALARWPWKDRISWLHWPSAFNTLAQPSGAARETAPGRTARQRPPALDRRIPELGLWLAEIIADYARQAEQRYDLAIGLLVALATVFIFYG